MVEDTINRVGGAVMDDQRIVELYWQRDEDAIKETKEKYGRYCYSIAYNILKSPEDAEECESDTYLEAWNAMPPERPDPLRSFIGMLSRRISLDKWRRKNAEKRGGGETALSFDELEECIPSGKGIDEELSEIELGRMISEFLSALPESECNVFLRRYFYFDSINDICKRYGFGQSKVKMMLKRTREKLMKKLTEEGIFV